MIRGRLLSACAATVLGVFAAVPALAQDIVKIGQVEALTGPLATYGWMGNQGAKMAVDEINKAGGFAVGEELVGERVALRVGRQARPVGPNVALEFFDGRRPDRGQE